MSGATPHGGTAEYRAASPSTVAEYVASFRSDICHLILLPTEQCNFRCTYCYEDFSVGRMEPGIVRGVKRFIDQRLGDLRLLHLSWFGGEPLLAADIVEDVSGHAMAAAGSGLRYIGDMTTNAYMLTGAMVDRMAAVGVRGFQVSLDGPQDLHDRTRVRADGRGTFQRLWGNLLSIRSGSAPVTVSLRVHLTPANLPEMPDFLGRLRDTFLDDARFTVLLKAVEHLGGPNDATTDIIDKRNRSEVLARLATIVQTPERPGSDACPDTPVCYAARPNSLVIRANGTLGKCTVSLDSPANDLGRLRPDGTLDIRNDRLRPWLRGWESGDERALHCPADGFTLREPVLLHIGPRPSEAS
ncbi:radical SAM protein [Streptomyces chrestomyceticus]|uniref:radical SAM protein n=1 Tax=Streptomyces chrestomyceticus TaxID=68185 RepID=UPI0036AEF8E1